MIKVVSMSTVYIVVARGPCLSDAYLMGLRSPLSWELSLWRAHKHCQLMDPLTISPRLPGFLGPNSSLCWNGPRRTISIELVGPLWWRVHNKVTTTYKSALSQFGGNKCTVTKQRALFWLRVFIILFFKKNWGFIK